MSLIKLSLAGNNLIIPGQGEFGIASSRLRTGKTIIFFYSVINILIPAFRHGYLNHMAVPGLGWYRRMRMG
jgi:hypothetical protein